MSVTKQPADQAARDRALDPRRSFIVQAPAGSGKTELLIQRYLRLLSIVDDPEEILAITFTRKAAGEMRARIETALAAAQRATPPDQPHLFKGYELARAVIARDADRGWGLVDQPARLRIGTIDSVNTRLSRRAPLSAGVTSQNAMLDDARLVYAEAARETLTLGEEADANGAAVRVLLSHCDNDASRVETLLTTMLARRDQWLPLTGSGRVEDGDELRLLLQRGLGQLVEHFLTEAANAMPEAERAELLACLRYAGERRAEHDADEDIVAWRDLAAMPSATAEQLAAWRGMANVLLTKGRHPKWRSRITVREGFPVGSGEAREMKSRATELLGRLATADAFRAALGVVGSLPNPVYSDGQWSIIASLWRVLPLTVAILRDLFARRGETDYAEVAREALDSLGREDAASELRLALDYQIKHILLDEYQDTSQSQYEFVRRLTDGWESETDRSLFVVGDPMQSIYRFREAEVGLFLDTCTRGIGGLKLEFLQLTTNFRSNAAVIAWFNAAFAEVFPHDDDMSAGAISFTASTAYDENDADAGVTWHPVPGGLPEVEAERVVRLIRAALDSGPGETVGVLVRSRRHAVAIAGRLRAENIDYAATGLENLHEQPLVQDLLALTRAVTHLGDRLAWLACLRAPWCGLTLVDLHAIAYADHDQCIWTLIEDDAVVARLTDDGQDRLARFRNVLAGALARRGAIALRDLVESSWLQLGGPATVTDDADLEQADLFFRFLDGLEPAADCADGAELLDRLGEVRIDRDGVQPRVQILTMHKAKGLEFDTVILPGLGLATRSGDKPLLLFDEIVRPKAPAGLVVAPIKPSDRSTDPLYELLWRFETERDRFEQQRLLYVAATRARRRLHLFAQLALNDDEENSTRPPASNTLLARLWPVAEREIDLRSVDLPVAETRASGRRPPVWREVPLLRLPADWHPPPAPESLGNICKARDADAETPVEFEWASQSSKHVGSVVHRWLQQIAEEGIESWSGERIEQHQPAMELALRRLGVGAEELRAALDRTVAALHNTLTDDRGRWILSSIHPEAANEVPVTTSADDRYANHVVDRTFVTDDGTRWIIDYKTSSHQGGATSAFLDSESERYRPQLRRYRDAFATVEQRPIRTALYFP
ncbi:MAG: UvrD-helicase domain-containing protein, partial [Gammaproteobacteria bacterium]